MIQALLIHGFNVWDGGQKTVGELRGYFASRDISYHILNYGHFGLWNARFKNDNIARKVAKFSLNTKDDIIAVGHSNGCAIIHLAIVYYGARIKHAVYINPALDEDILMPRETTFDVWHSPSDCPVLLSKILPEAKFRPWGAMGAYGSLDKGHPGIINYNKEVDFDVVSDEHSDVFHTEKLSYFGPLIVDTALRRVNEKTNSSP